MTVRANDLPVTWDGAECSWLGWRQEPWTSRPFHVKPEPCDHCGQVAGMLHNMGCTVQRTPAGIVRKRYRLFAFRCQGCGHDQVLDHDTDELWDLDETDYGPGGSEVTQKELF